MSTFTQTITPYIFFGGQCEEALEFYKSAIGAEVEGIMYFNQSPDPAPEGMLSPGFENKVMHSSLHIGSSVVFASDGSGENERSKNVSLALALTSKEEADKAFAALSEGGQAFMPLCETFWSPYFGMLQDKFGIGWMVMVNTTK